MTHIHKVTLMLAFGLALTAADWTGTAQNLQCGAEQPSSSIGWTGKETLIIVSGAAECCDACVNAAPESVSIFVGAPDEVVPCCGYVWTNAGDDACYLKFGIAYPSGYQGTHTGGCILTIEEDEVSSAGLTYAVPSAPPSPPTSPPPPPDAPPPAASGCGGGCIGGIVGGCFVPLLMLTLWLGGAFARYGWPSPLKKKEAPADVVMTSLGKA